jgi:hypothetical protein
MKAGASIPTPRSSLAEVFHSVVSELAIEDPEERARVAKVVIRLAHGQMAIEAEKLRSAAIAELGG